MRSLLRDAVSSSHPAAFDGSTSLSCHTRVASVSIVMLLAFIASSQADEQQAEQIRFPRTANERALLLALQKPVRLEALSLPLRELITRLSQECGVLIQPDLVALDEEGLSLNEPYDCRLQGSSCQQFIESLLEPHGLTWTIHRGIIEITTTRVAQESLVTRALNVEAVLRLARPFRERIRKHRESQQFHGGSMPASDSVKGSPGPPGMGFFQILGRSQPATLHQHQFGSTSSLGGLAPTGPHHAISYSIHSLNDQSDHAWLIDFIMSHTTGPWVDYDGLGGTMNLFGNVLVVRHHLRQLMDIELLLNATLKCGAADSTPPEGLCASRSPARLAAAARLSTALQQLVELQLEGQTLEAVLADLQRHYQLNIVTDTRALKEEGVSLDTPIQLQVSGITLRSALRLILDRVHLTYQIDGSILRIRPVLKAVEEYDTYLFNVSSIDSKHDTLTGLDAIIQEATPGPWLDIDGEGGTLTLVLPHLLAVTANPQTIDATREVLQQIDSTITPGAHQDEPSSEARFIRKLYRVKDEKTARQLVEVLPLVVSQSTWPSAAILRNVDETLILSGPSALHDELTEFLADFDAQQSDRVKHIRVSPHAP